MDAREFERELRMFKLAKRLKLFFGLLVNLFALAGFILIAGFFAIRFHWTDSPGQVDPNDDFFAGRLQGGLDLQDMSEGVPESELSVGSLAARIGQLSEIKDAKKRVSCLTRGLADISPYDARKIIDTLSVENNYAAALKMIEAWELQIDPHDPYFRAKEKCTGLADEGDYGLEPIREKVAGAAGGSRFAWSDSEEWQALKEATRKDKDKIIKAAAAAGVRPRMLAACMIGEQLRLFNSQREVFKRFFEPLKILGNADQISLGVMGIKENTAEETEKNLKDRNSQCYLGKDMEGLLDFPGDDRSRFEKLTEESHNYSYLYGAVYIREMLEQWRRAGYPIDDRPEIVGTLFNVGFPQSKPKADPKVGGSVITVAGREYSFGRLAYEFYYSGELADVFWIR